MQKIIAIAAISFVIMGAGAASAGGFGHGPSLSQAKKIAKQANRDAINGVKSGVIPAAGAAAVVGACIATSGAICAPPPPTP
jgi:hypothetical protein